MSWFDDEADGVGSDRWMSATLDVREPFATAFRLSRTRRYDLLAQWAKRLKVPGTETSTATSIFLHHLYEFTAEAWRCGQWRLNKEQCRNYVAHALSFLDDDDFDNLVCDMEWDRDLTATVTLRTYRHDMQEAFARRFAERLLHVLRKARQAQRPAA